jgi:hypothetical protein
MRNFLAEHSVLGILSVEDDHDLALVTVGGVVDSWIEKARRPLHFDMPIEDRTPVCTENLMRIDCVTESPKRQRR